MALIRYQIQPTGESSVSIELLRSGLRRRKHVLFFQQYNGHLSYDPETLEQASFTLTVGVASMICRDAWLAPAERQAVVASMTEMLGAENCPHLVFRSERLESITRRRAKVTGALTLRSASSPAVLDATIVPVGRDQLEVDASATLQLSGYGIEPKRTWWGQPSIKDAARMRLLLWPATGNGMEGHPRAAATHAARR